MEKNVSGQVVAAHLINKTDGSNVTSGTVTVYVTGDGGSQSSGSGSVSHKGNGLWEYFPTQAETNYKHIAFTFVHADAICVTVQVYTNCPQTGDAYEIVANGTYGNFAIKGYVDDLESRLTATRAQYLDNLSGGAVALNSDMQTLLSRIVGTLASGTHNPQSGDAYEVVTNGIYGLSALKNLIDAIDDYVDTEVAAIKATTDKLDTAMEADGGVYRFTQNALEMAPSGSGVSDWTSDEKKQIRDALGIDGDKVTAANGQIQTLLSRIVGTLASGTHQPQSGDAYAIVNHATYGNSPIQSLVSQIDLTTALIQSQTDKMTFTSNKINAQVKGLDDIDFSDTMKSSLSSAIFSYLIEGTKTFAEYIRIMFSALALKSSGGGTTTIRFRDLADTKDRISATVDSGGNRTSVTLDGT